MRSPRTETVVWLLGAGFSKPLGGPLFADLFGPNIDRWVNAWLKWKGIQPPPALASARSIFTSGLNAGLWRDAETCLTLLDEARTDEMAREVIRNFYGPNVSTVDVDAWWRGLSQFVAVATSFYVDRVRNKKDLPESWNPYVAWWRALTKSDSIVSFNYDLVVDELKRRQKKAIKVFKLHGSVPQRLAVRISADKGIDGMAMPGPSKASAPGNSWQRRFSAESVPLITTERLVILGYSFPPTDPSIRSWILGTLTEDPAGSHLKHVDIVVGPDPVGARIEAMFRRFFPRIGIRNTGFLVEQFLTEGTVKLDNGRFNHRLGKPNWTKPLRGSLDGRGSRVGQLLIADGEVLVTASCG